MLAIDVVLSALIGPPDCAAEMVLARAEAGEWQPVLLDLALYCAMAEPPKYKFVDNLRPPCSSCGRPLVLTRIEPEEPGFDLRTYFCANCDAIEAVIAPI